MRRALQRSVWSLSLICCAPALAEEPAPLEAPAPAAEPAEEGASCPALFGDEQLRAESEAWRKERLLSVEREEGVIEIVHSVPQWNEPVARTAPGMTVVAVDPATGTARVAVHDRWSRWCRPGVYRVRLDDALGANSQVLAVLDEGLLASHPEGLMLLPAEGAARATKFRMIWRSAFGISSAGGGSGAGSTTSARASGARATDLRKNLGREAPMKRAIPRSSRVKKR